eukprot:2136432-Rhodomonas_salina.4
MGSHVTESRWHVPQVNVPRLKELCRHRDSGASNLSSSSSSLALASAAGSSCNVRACYGPPGGKALYCTRHKLAGHVDVINGRCHGPPEPTGSRKFKLNLNGSDSADPGPADRRASDSDSLSGNGTASGCGDAKRGVTCSRRPSFGLPSDRHPRFCKYEPLPHRPGPACVFELTFAVGDTRQRNFAPASVNSVTVAVKCSARSQAATGSDRLRLALNAEGGW